MYPNILLVGAAGRNAGKTTLICSIIRNTSRHNKVIGVKVTAVDEGRAACPHGKGCGACGTLESDFSIIEELARDSDKDTARMLEAGASRVFWLRARRYCMREGIAALMSCVEDDAAVVCESTSARACVEPGLFFIAKRSDSDDRKKSAAAAWELADRIVPFDGSCFDLDPCDISVSHGRWALRRDATAIVMAGGLSSRMGTDKALLEIDGRPLIERIANQLRPHFKELLISANDPEKYSFLNLPVIVDREKNRGPLMGIASALAASRHGLNFVHACDIPVTDMELMQRLMRASRGNDAAVARAPDGRMEPLFAAYRKSALPAMHEVLSAGENRIRMIFDRCLTAFVEIDARLSPANINTLEEYQACVRS